MSFLSGEAQIASSPVFERTDPEKGGLRIKFCQAKGSLRTPLADLAGFELAGEERVFEPATVVIDNDTVLEHFK